MLCPHKCNLACSARCLSQQSHRERRRDWLAFAQGATKLRAGGRFAPSTEVQRGVQAHGRHPRLRRLPTAGDICGAQHRLRSGTHRNWAELTCLARVQDATNVGDEGGFAPSINSTTEGLDLIVAAIEVRPELRV